MLWMLMKLEKDINLKLSWRHGGANVWQSQSLAASGYAGWSFVWCHLWIFDIFYAVGCLRTKWCEFLSTCKAYQSFSPSPSSNLANPDQPAWFSFRHEGGHFGQERSSNHCRCPSTERSLSLKGLKSSQENDILWYFGENGEAPFFLTVT